MDKVIITAALTGAMTPKDANPNLPMTPREIAEDAYRCYKAGAAVVHLHMRDEANQGVMDAARFGETATLIREKCDVIINMTTSGEAGASDEKRMAHLQLKPEMASFDAGSFNWMPAGIFENSPQFLAKLAETMKQYQIKPEMEIFDSGFMNIVDYYVKQGLLETPVHYQFALGVLGGMEATVENLLYLYNRLPKDATWSAFGIGKNHLKILYATIALGGHVRVGLEDCIYYAKGRLATNEQLVARAVRLVNEFQKVPATPDEARGMLNLKRRL